MLHNTSYSMLFISFPWRFLCNQQLKLVCISFQTKNPSRLLNVNDIMGGRAFLLWRDGWHPSPRFIGLTRLLRVWKETPHGYTFIRSFNTSQEEKLNSSDFRFRFPSLTSKWDSTIYTIDIDILFMLKVT